MVADVSVAAEGLEEGVGHDDVAVGAGVHAVVGAGEGIVFAVLGLGLGHDIDHE